MRKVVFREIEDGYPKHSCTSSVKGFLTNGQWLPLQICLLRDGSMVQSRVVPPATRWRGSLGDGQ